MCPKPVTILCPVCRCAAFCSLECQTKGHSSDYCACMATERAIFEASHTLRDSPLPVNSVSKALVDELEVTTHGVRAVAILTAMRESKALKNWWLPAVWSAMRFGGVPLILARSYLVEHDLQNSLPRLGRNQVMGLMCSLLVAMHQTTCPHHSTGLKRSSLMVAGSCAGDLLLELEPSVWLLHVDAEHIASKAFGPLTSSLLFNPPANMPPVKKERLLRILVATCDRAKATDMVTVSCALLSAMASHPSAVRMFMKDVLPHVPPSFRHVLNDSSANWINGADTAAGFDLILQQPALQGAALTSLDALFDRRFSIPRLMRLCASGPEALRASAARMMACMAPTLLQNEDMMIMLNLPRSPQLGALCKALVSAGNACSMVSTLASACIARLSVHERGAEQLLPVVTDMVPLIQGDDFLSAMAGTAGLIAEWPLLKTDGVLRLVRALLRSSARKAVADKMMEFKVVDALLLARNVPVAEFEDVVRDVLLRRCAGCGQRDAPCKKCSRCRLRQYCSGACQTRHWEGAHKDECKTTLTLEDVATSA